MEEQKWSGGLDLNMAQNDPRDFNLDVLGGWFGTYTPKYQRVILPVLTTKNQKSQNTCVCESGALQKEVDEGVALSPQSVACYLRNRGEMNSQGTSLIAYQKASIDFGIAELVFTENNYDVSWDEFSNSKHLTDIVKNNAKTHSAGSFWRTDSLDTVLRQIDLAKDGGIRNGIGQTGSHWYTGYNPSQLPAPYVIKLQSGAFVGGHAFIIVGYDMNYHGQRVVALMTSYGDNIYDNKVFYLRFEDFNKMLTFGVYYTLDIPRNIAEWLSKNANKAIIENNSPKVWVIEDGKKRYVPDEAMMFMLEITPSELIPDAEVYLKDIPEGEPMSIKDIPLEKQEHIKYLIQMSVTPGFLSDRFKDYYPDIFKK